MSQQQMVHHLAHFEPGCELGPGCKIWQFASVIRGARLGAHVNVGAGAIIDGATVGSGCLIGAHAQIHPGAVLEDEVFIGPGAVLCNDMYPSASKTGWDLEAVKSKPTIIIERGASVGANAVVLPGLRIGAGALIGAGAVVRHSVLPHKLLRSDGQTYAFDRREFNSQRIRHA